MSSKNEKIEKMLYGTFLDLSYSTDIYKEMIEETAENLKQFKVLLRKSEKLLAKCIEQYKQLNGSEPKKR